MDEKQAITSVFNLIAGLYDNPSLRFFPSCAEKITDHVKIKRGIKALDVATGTGQVAISIAKAVGKEGRVQAIDLSENMLDQAIKNARNEQVNNIDFHIMDGETPEFNNDYFDLVTSSYGLFFMPDMQRALSNWLNVLKPGGKVLFTSFAPSAFEPLSKIFMENLAEYGITPPTPRWLQLSEEEMCSQLLEENGFENAKVQQVQLGYFLSDEDAWWQCIQSAGYRGLYEQLPSEARDEFKQKHLKEIKKQKTSEGIWLDVKTLFSTADKPG